MDVLDTANSVAPSVHPGIYGGVALKAVPSRRHTKMARVQALGSLRESLLGGPGDGAGSNVLTPAGKLSRRKSRSARDGGAGAGGVSRTIVNWGGENRPILLESSPAHTEQLNELVRDVRFAQQTSQSREIDRLAKMKVLKTEMKQMRAEHASLPQHVQDWTDDSVWRAVNIRQRRVCDDDLHFVLPEQRRAALRSIEDTVDWHVQEAPVEEPVPIGGSASFFAAAASTSRRRGPRPPACIPPDSKLLPQGHRLPPRRARTITNGPSAPAEMHSTNLKTPSHGQRRLSAARHIEEALHQAEGGLQLESWHAA